MQIPLYQEILRLDPDNIDGLNSLAQCLKLSRAPSNEVYTQCRSLYSRALSMDPEDYESNFNMGVLLYEFKRDIEKAIHHFKVAINEEANPTALFNLAVIYDERGERQDAKRTY